MSTRNTFSNKPTPEETVGNLKEFLLNESLSRFRFAMSLFIFFAGFGLLLGDPGELGLYDPRWIRITHVCLICLSIYSSFRFPNFRKYCEAVLLIHFGIISVHSFYLLYANGLYLGYLFGLILVVFSTGVSISNRRVLIPVLLLFIAGAFFVGMHVQNPRIEVGMYYFGLISSSLLSVLVIEFRMRTFETLLEADVQLEKFRSNIEEELTLAQSTQKSLVDLEFPRFGDFRIYAMFKPLESVGGDVIKSHLGNNGNLDVFFADAAGHGISAAMVSAMAVLGFKTAASVAETPAQGLILIHESLINMIRGFFITAVYLRLDKEKKSLTYSYAGHHPALLIKKDGSVRQLEGRGTVLLALPKILSRNYDVSLEPGDRIFLFSDGLFEFFDKDKRFFGYESFLGLTEEYTSFYGQEFLETISEAVLGLNHFPLKDDMTMLLVELN
ncbi:serine/threonine-protein phosphatase [Leptospira wolffii]|uniref:Serine/threonine protein phosphatase n=1 Tax=Leptospira wolffii TaxID=409998 RepID=A0A2M9Z7W0_9LEPT|nr:PP2C family protein-serine/threonine phosphatase [Leptospira wolffii]PJZ64488.1 serine/threonine protein phosphatase [Leptospira wolffii]TGK55262.1 serine/threonine-protein phosphatase [Leptospira wolffii]TGK65771.1 serine/threonine-protein phosphatase [Leptospira wolffii]TGK70437.1 serine/threonine-protein phosphatase [Leptospira wolffii]TGL30027.1 serine/threonine-protein phosphatase [Leptospira wolffii]